MKPDTVLCADFDGTLFDPSIRILLSPVYNNQTSRLMRKQHVLFVINTGRPVWDRFAHLQNYAIGMHKPDVVIAGAGTKIMWKRRIGYESDSVWEAKMQAARWDKNAVRAAITRDSGQTKLSLFDTANPYMARAWVYRKEVTELERIKKNLEDALPDTKILLTEQILLPNTTEYFSGYLLFIPRSAGKDQASQFVINALEEKHGVLKKIYAGDALVDVPLLLHDASSRAISVGLNLTPLARAAVKNSHVLIRDGSPPMQLQSVLKSSLKSVSKPQNSPYRTLLRPFEAVIDRSVMPDRTPDELSYKGLEMVRSGIQHIYAPTTGPSRKLKGFLGIFGGVLIDVADGIRAKRNPDSTSSDGQLIDGYADRNKEFIQLAARAQARQDERKKETLAAALSCFLPAIARARAECLDISVEELDQAGGSALSRNARLLTSLAADAAGLTGLSYRIDKEIYTRNMKTYEARLRRAPTFDWTKLPTYNRASADRLTLYVEMFREAVKETSMQDWAREHNLHEYLSFKPAQSVLRRIRISNHTK